MDYSLPIEILFLIIPKNIIRLLSKKLYSSYNTKFYEILKEKDKYFEQKISYFTKTIVFNFKPKKLICEGFVSNGKYIYRVDKNIQSIKINFDKKFIDYFIFNGKLNIIDNKFIYIFNDDNKFTKIKHKINIDGKENYFFECNKELYNLKIFSNGSSYLYLDNNKIEYLSSNILISAICKKNILILLYKHPSIKNSYSIKVYHSNLKIHKYLFIYDIELFKDIKIDLSCENNIVKKLKIYDPYKKISLDFVI